MVPWVTAAAVTLTLRLMTTVPVLAFTTTLAAVSPGITSKFSIMDTKATRWPVSAGARTVMEVASSALATPWPKVSLMTSTMALVVVKSESRTLSTTESDLPNGLSTARSTCAPFGMRPAVGTPMVTLEPAALVSKPVVAMAPCAKA